MKIIERLRVLLYALVLTLLVTGCGTKAERLQRIKSRVTGSNDGRSFANQAQDADVDQYRLEMAVLMAENDTMMSQFKRELKTESKETNPYYNSQINDLEQRSAAIRKRLDDYDSKSGKDWTSFKKEFGDDMLELREAFRNLSVKKTTLHMNTMD